MGECCTFWKTGLAMLPALVEKASYVGAMVALYDASRVSASMLGVATMDAI